MDVSWKNRSVHEVTDEAAVLDRRFTLKRAAPDARTIAAARLSSGCAEQRGRDR